MVEDEKNLEKDKVEPGFGISSVLSKMGSATKALKESVESTHILSEFNREQEKFIKEKSELKHVNVRGDLGYIEKGMCFVKIVVFGCDFTYEVAKCGHF